jgi:hypothetical protein
MPNFAWRSLFQDMMSVNIIVTLYLPEINMRRHSGGAPFDKALGSSGKTENEAA